MKERHALRVALLGPANTVHLQRWAAALAGRGHTVCVISQHRCDPALLPRAVRVVWLPYQAQIGYFANAWILRRELRRWRPDLLNAHYASGYGTTAALAGYSPTLLSVWGSDVYDFPNEGALKTGCCDETCGVRRRLLQPATRWRSRCKASRLSNST